MVDFKNGLDGFYHSFIPAELRESLTQGTAVYIRVRALSSLLVITTIIAAAASVSMAGYNFFYRPEFLANNIPSVFVVILLLLQVGLFYKNKNYWMSGLAFTNFYFLIVVLLVIAGGGFDSAAKSILLTCPVISFLVGGRQEGIQNTFSTIAFVLALMVLEIINFDLPRLGDTGDQRMIFTVYWLSTILIMCSCIAVYETELLKDE